MTEGPTTEQVRLWRPEGLEGVLALHGRTTSYAVDPVGEVVVGLVAGRPMRAARGGQRHVVVPGQLVAWDPSAAHAGSAAADGPWEARLLVLELADVQRVLDDPDGAVFDLQIGDPVIDDAALARRFVSLHQALEGPASVLERQTRLTEWLSDVLHRRVPATAELRARRAARNDPALRAACELLADDPAANVTLDALAAVAGVSRFRLTRLFRTGLGLPPHRYQVAQRVRLARALLEQGHAPGAAAALAGFTDQSHLHRHFRRALGITPGRYAALTAAARTNVQDAAGPAA